MAEQEIIEAEKWSSQGLIRIELDHQVATAREFPRPAPALIGRQITDMATENDGVAQECIYALKRGSTVITGPSVRFAEIVAVCWGNAEYGSKIIEESQEWVTAQAVYRDLEKNNRVMVEVKRRILDSNNRRYGIDMIGVTAMAAQSIAMRNAIFKGVPRAVWGTSFAKVQAMIGGTFENVEKRRTAALDAFRKMGVEEELVLAMLELKNVEEIAPEDIVILRGTLQAIKDGDTTLQQTFGPLRSAAKPKADVGAHLDKGKATNGKAQSAKAEQGAAQGGGANGGAEGGGASIREGGAGNGGNDGAPGVSGEGGNDADGADQSGDGGSAGGGETGGPEGANTISEAEAEAAARNADDGAGADAEPGTIAEPYLKFLTPFEGGELKKLTDFALALSKCTTPVQVTQAQMKAAPNFESASVECEKAFGKLAAEAAKIARAARSASAGAKL